MGLDLTAKKKLLEAEETAARQAARIAELESALSTDLDRASWLMAQAKIRELFATVDSRGEHISELYKMIGHAVQHLRLLRYDDARALLEALLPELPPAEPGTVMGDTSSAEELAKAEWELAQAALLEAAGSGDPAKYNAAMQRAQKAKIALAAAPPAPPPLPTPAPFAPDPIETAPAEAPTEPAPSS